MNAVIRTRFSVDDYLGDQAATTEEFSKVSSRWQQEEWVKYLYEHGTIITVEPYKDIQKFSTIFETTWELSEKKKTFLLLKWSEQLDKIFF